MDLFALSYRRLLRHIDDAQSNSEIAGKKNGGGGTGIPIIAKPNLFLCSYAVQRIETMNELRTYRHSFPRRDVIVLQRYVNELGEADTFTCATQMRAGGID